jgi:uncharacterized protein (DUF1778 family)
MSLENMQYSKRGTIDWAGLTKGIATEINQIGIDKQKAIAENEAILDETNRLLNKPLNLEKQSLTQFTLDSANQYKQMALDLKRKLYNKEISTAEYKKTLANTMEYWQNFADQVKTADDRWQLYQERNTPDANGVVAASDAENFLMEQYLKAADLNNKKMVIGKDGSMYLQEVDEAGNPVGELIDYRDFARPENMQINRTDVGQAVAGMIGEWKSVDKWINLGMEGYQNITSIVNHPEYMFMKAKVATSLTSNPKTAVSILVDNGVVDQGNYYTSDAEKDQMLAQQIAETKKMYEAAGKQFTDDDRKRIELSFVKFEKNQNGEFVPILTEDQIVAAKDRVGKEIDMQIETSIQGSPRQVNMGGGGANGGGAGGTGTEGEIYPEMLSAWELSKSDRKGSEAKLTSMAKGEYIFKWQQGGLAVYKDADAVMMNTPTITNIQNLESLAPYIYGASGAKGTDEAINQYKRERENYRARNPRSGGTNANPKGGASNSGGNARD